jgi:chromosome segregation ATPase
VDLETQRAEAQQRVAAARGELERTETAFDQRTAALLAAQVEVRELEKAQAEGHAQRQALESELARIRAELVARGGSGEAVTGLGREHVGPLTAPDIGAYASQLRVIEKRGDRRRGSRRSVR